MTGRGPSQFRIDTALNVHWPADDAKNMAHFLPVETMTVTRLLQNAGYRTGHFGVRWGGLARETNDCIRMNGLYRSLVGLPLLFKH